MTAPSEAPANDKAEGAKSNPVTASSSSSSGGEASVNDADVEAAGDLAQAYRELARGEKTATDMEANLTRLESKLDAILAAFDAAEAQGSSSSSSSGGAGENGQKEKDAKKSS